MKNCSVETNEIRFDLFFVGTTKDDFSPNWQKHRRSIWFRCQHTALSIRSPIALWPFRGRMHPVCIQSFHVRPRVMRSHRNLDYFSTNTKLSSTKFHCQWDWSRPRKCLTWCLLLHYVPIPGDLSDGHTKRNRYYAKWYPDPSISTPATGSTKSMQNGRHLSLIRFSIDCNEYWFQIKLIHREHNTTNRRERNSGHRSP